MNRSWLLLLVLLAVPAAATAGGTTSSDPMAVVNPSDFHWKPKDALPPGASGAVLRGDPAAGAYDFLGRFPDRFTVPLHYHTSEVVVLMVKGSMVIGRPRRPDLTIAEGGLFVLPARMAYTARCQRTCTFLVHGERPFDIIYSNPADDPRRSR